MYSNRILFVVTGILQLDLNCMLFSCLAAAGQWAQVLEASDKLQRALPSKAKSSSKAAAGWRAAALAHVGHRVTQEMNRLQADFSQPDIKVKYIDHDVALVGMYVLVRPMADAATCTEVGAALIMVHACTCMAYTITHRICNSQGMHITTSLSIT
jgi:hypothetical protein